MLEGCPGPLLQGHHMSTSFSYSASTTFTITHARHLASKVAADMRQLNLHYGYPLLSTISDYEEELAVLLRDGYVEQYEFGFKRNNMRVISCQYSPSELYGSDDRPGRVDPSADTTGAVYFNHLWRSQAWWSLSESDRTTISARLPIERVGMAAPTDGKGYWTSDKSYGAGGKSLQRSVFRPAS